MRKKNVGAARRPTTLHQRASSTKKYPKCPIETKMIAAVFSQSVSSTGGDTLFERVASKIPPRWITEARKSYWSFGLLPPELNPISRGPARLTEPRRAGTGRLTFGDR